MKRYIGTVGEFKKLVNPKHNYREGEAKCDWDKYENIVVIKDIKEFDTGKSVSLICEPYLESKGIPYTAMFYGNTIAFDAIEKDGKLIRVSNVCGKSARYYTGIDNNHNLISTAEINDYCTLAHCISCKHFNIREGQVKKTCGTNRLPII